MSGNTRRNAPVMRLRRAMEAFEQSEFQYAHAGLLSDLGERLVKLSEKIEMG